MSAARPQKINWRQWRERGQGLVEYALILALVAIVILAVLTYLGTVVQVNMYSKISSSMEAVVH